MVLDIMLHSCGTYTMKNHPVASNYKSLVHLISTYFLEKCSTNTFLGAKNLQNSKIWLFRFLMKKTSNINTIFDPGKFDFSIKNVQLANQVYVGRSKQMIKTKNLTLLCSINRLRVKDQSKIRSVKEKMGLGIWSCLYHPWNCEFFCSLMGQYHQLIGTKCKARDVGYVYHKKVLQFWIVLPASVMASYNYYGIKTVANLWHMWSKTSTFQIFPCKWCS